MQKEPQDAALDVVVWKTYSQAIDAAEGRSVRPDLASHTHTPSPTPDRQA